MGEDI